MKQTIVDILVVQVFFVGLLLQGAIAANYERKCRNQIIDCGDKMISFKLRPIARELPEECQNDAGCRNVIGCPSTRNCTSPKPVETFLEECRCNSKCQVTEVKGQGDCYYFDVIYECVDKCSAASWLLPVIIASAVFIVLLIMIIIIVCVIRRRRKQRHRRSMISTLDIQKANEVHRRRNEKLAFTNSDGNKNVNMTEIHQMNVEYQDVGKTGTDGMEQTPFTSCSCGNDGGSSRQCKLKCCGVSEAKHCHGCQRNSQDMDQEANTSFVNNSTGSRKSSPVDKNGDYILVENENLALYVRNDDGELTIPRTKLNKKNDNVLKQASQNGTDVSNDMPSIGEDYGGDYDNVMFGNCGNTDQGEARTLWQTNLNKTQESVCDDVYDNVLYEGNQGQILPNSSLEGTAGAFPVEFNSDLQEGIGGNPEGHHLSGNDFSLLYDNVEYSEGCGSIVNNESKVDESQGEHGVDYDNVEYNDEHGEVVEFVDKGIVHLHSRSLPVIYEYDEGISMENDEYDEEVKVIHGADAMNNGADGRTHNTSCENCEDEDKTITPGQNMFPQGQDDLCMHIGQGQIHGITNQGQSQSDFDDGLNNLILDQEVDSQPENYTANLYDSLLQSNFQKPVDYGMKQTGNICHKPPPGGQARVKGQGQVRSPGSQQTTFPGVNYDYSPSSSGNGREQFHFSPDELSAMEGSDLYEGAQRLPCLDDTNEPDTDIFQSDEYY